MATECHSCRVAFSCCLHISLLLLLCKVLLINRHHTPVSPSHASCPLRKSHSRFPSVFRRPCVFVAPRSPLLLRQSLSVPNASSVFPLGGLFFVFFFFCLHVSVISPVSPLTYQVLEPVILAPSGNLWVTSTISSHLCKLSCLICKTHTGTPMSGMRVRVL